MSVESATAFAPGSVGNVGVGFDVLGFALDVVGDRVRATRRAEPGVEIARISDPRLPREAGRNTAGRAVQSLLAATGAPFGVTLEIEKGIPLGSGLGGSAASAVAAVVAANALLDAPLELEALLEHALEGEAVASGARHPDNVAPSLLGGLVLAVGEGPFRLVRVPVPAGVSAVVAHPHMELATREARAILAPTVSLGVAIRQAAHLAGLIAACYTGDVALARASLEDVLIEPQRKVLIPGFDAARAAALEAGALGGSISGAGPTLFFWAEDAVAPAVRAALVAALEGAGHGVDHWIVPLDSAGARVEESGPAA